MSAVAAPAQAHACLAQRIAGPVPLKRVLLFLQRAYTERVDDISCRTFGASEQCYVFSCRGPDSLKLRRNNSLAIDYSLLQYPALISTSCQALLARRAGG